MAIFNGQVVVAYLGNYVFRCVQCRAWYPFVRLFLSVSRIDSVCLKKKRKENTVHSPSINGNKSIPGFFSFDTLKKKTIMATAWHFL